MCIGSPYAGRDEPGTRHVIGYFVNILAMMMVAPVSNHMNTKDVATARTTVLGAFEHSGVPFHRVVEALRVERDASRTPVFQAMFVLVQVEDTHRRAATDDDGHDDATNVVEGWGS